MAVSTLAALFVACGDDLTSSGILRTDTSTATALCARICGCAYENDALIVVSPTCAAEVDRAYGLPRGTYERAIVIHEQCHLYVTGLCPREEERRCIEAMRGALRDYQVLLADTRAAWDNHYKKLPCNE